MKIFAEESSRFAEESVIKIAFIRWWDNCISSTSRDWRVSGSRCDCDKVFIRDRVASRCTCSRVYRIREIIMRAFISFDKRLCRLQFRAPDATFREWEKSARLFQEKQVASLSSRGETTRANVRVTGFIYVSDFRWRIARRHSVGSCAYAPLVMPLIAFTRLDSSTMRILVACSAHPADLSAKFPPRRIIPGNAIFWMNAGTAAYKNIVTPRR